jgi:tryptophan synthase alpha chain
MIQRIQQRFEQARRESRAASVAFITAGDPDAATSLEVARSLLASGVDVLELGVPFSDPLADGPTNQLAAERALAAGVSPLDVFDLVKALRKDYDQPIVLYTYYNIVFNVGEDAYAKLSAEAGVDGLLILDLPPEESDSMRTICAEADLALIHLLAPTSGRDRIAKICAAATGFIYYVSREGITGERTDLPADLSSAVALIKEYTDLPVAVGFGISTPEQVKNVAQVADGVVVGSALVNTVAKNVSQKETIPQLIKEKATALFGGDSLKRLTA